MMVTVGYGGKIPSFHSGKTGHDDDHPLMAVDGGGYAQKNLFWNHPLRNLNEKQRFLFSFN